MGHYFDEDPDAPSMPRDVELWLPDMSLTLTTDRGVFGYGQIDAGSKLLLLKAPPPPPAGNLLDLGCGVGTIALPLARRAPDATVWAVDVNGRARDLCAANAAANDDHQCARRRAGRGARRRLASTASGATRRSASASRRCTSCCCAGSPGSTPDGYADSGRAEAPRLRLAAALADRPGLPDRANRLLERLPNPARTKRVEPQPRSGACGY